MVGVGLGIGVSPSMYGSIVSGFDADAQAFISAASITDATQQSAINQLVLDLKAYSLWTKMYAVYPFVGGSASAHKWNLKNPVDSDAAFRLTFSGGWTHSSTGALPNGTNAYADTNFNTLTNFTAYDNHISFYSKTSAGYLLEISMGVGDSLGKYGQSLYVRRASDDCGYDSGNSAGSNRAQYSNTDGTGYYVGSITANNSRKYYRNAVLKVTEATTLTQQFASKNIYICAYNEYDVGSPNYFSNKETAFSTIGTGLTGTDVTNLNTCVNTYQTTLSRNV